MTGAPRRPVRDKRAFYPPWPRRAGGHPGAAPAPGLSSRLSFSLTRAHVRNTPSHRPDRPSPGHGPAAQAVQACAGILAGAGYYLAAGPWHEPASGPGLHALAPAAALCLGPVDPSGLRAALTALEIPVVETWAAPASPLDSAVLLANAESGRQAARHFADSATRASPASAPTRRGNASAARVSRRRADAGPGTGGRHRAARGLAAERRPDGPAAAGHQYPVRRRVRQFGPAGRRLCPRPTTAICMCRRMSRCWDCQRTAARGNGRRA